MTVETLRVTPSLSLRAPDGTPVVLSEVRARLEYQAETLQSVWLLAELDPAAWQHVDQGELFHLQRDKRGPCFGEFRPHATVFIEARLARDPLTALALLGDNEWEVLAQIYGAKLVPSLHDTESWYALHVTQQQGPIKGGFRTTWADATEVPPSPA